MKCQYCEKEAKEDYTCGSRICVHRLEMVRRDYREIKRFYKPELGPKRSEEQSLKELGF